MEDEAWFILFQLLQLQHSKLEDEDDDDPLLLAVDQRDGGAAALLCCCCCCFQVVVVVCCGRERAEGVSEREAAREGIQREGREWIERE